MGVGAHEEEAELDPRAEAALGRASHLEVRGKRPYRCGGPLRRQLGSIWRMVTQSTRLTTPSVSFRTWSFLLRPRPKVDDPPLSEERRATSTGNSEDVPARRCHAGTLPRLRSLGYSRFGRAGVFRPIALNRMPRAHAEKPTPIFAACRRKSCASSSLTQMDRAALLFL